MMTSKTESTKKQLPLKEIAVHEEKFQSLLALLKENDALKEKLKSASDTDSIIAIIQSAGFEITKEEWINHQRLQSQELSDEALEGASGGEDNTGPRGGCPSYFWGGEWKGAPWC